MAASPGSKMRNVAFTAPSDRLSTLPSGEPKFTLGWEAIRWAEGSLIQPNGPRAGLRFQFTQDQLRFLLHWYAMDSTGHWLYHHGVRRLAKGSGKSPFAAILALIEFCAPVRLDRKDTRAPGGCVGKPVAMPLVQIAATAESQTQNTMRMIRAFAPKDSFVVDEHGLDPGKTRYYKLPEGTLEIITSSVTASEGAESSFVIADETEWWKPSNSGPELASTLADNLAKSGSRMLETSNAWVPGQECVAESTWDAWVAQEEGRTRGDTKILYDSRIAPPDTDMADLESLTGALEWIYGDCVWKYAKNGRPDVRAQVERIWSPMSTPSESRRKYLNLPSVQQDAYWDPQQWSALVDLTRTATEVEPVVLFFDGSKSRDATAIVACCVDDGFMFVPKWPNVAGCTIWEPNRTEDDSVVPVEDVDMALEDVFRRYNVVAYFGDVQEWESFVKIEWPKRFRDRLLIWAQPTGNDQQLIAWDMRGHLFDFTKAVELADAEIINAGFRHDGNPILARHIANCRRRPNRWGVSVGKESPSSPLKIDAAVCVVGARMVRRLVIASGKLPKPKSGKPRRATVL